MLSRSPGAVWAGITQNFWGWLGHAGLLRLWLQHPLFLSQQQQQASLAIVAVRDPLEALEYSVFAYGGVLSRGERERVRTAGRTALLGCAASYYLGKAVECWSSQKGRADDRSAWAAELEEKQRDLLEAKERLVRSDRLDAEDA